MPMPSPPAEDESGSGPGDNRHPHLLAECQRLLEEVPAAAASSPAFRRHWPSISASLAALSADLAGPAFPPAAPLLAPLAAALRALLSVSSVPAAGKDAAPRLGHLHTVSLLSSTAAELAQLAADARLLAAPAPAPTSSSAAAASDPTTASGDGLVSRLRMGSAASRAAALDELASAAASLPAPTAAAAVSAVAALLDSATACCSNDLRDRAVAALAALASSSSDAARSALAQEASTIVPHLCRALESSGSGSGYGGAASAAATTEHACAALLPLTASSRDACAAVVARGGVAALLCACAGGTPAAQAAAAGVLRSLAAHADLLPAFRDEESGGAVPLLLQLVSLGTPRAQEQALGCLQRLTAGDGDDAQRLKVEAFQAGALACVRDFLDDGRGVDGGESSEPPGLAPALGLLRNMASFRYIAEIAAASGGGTFVAHVVAALGSDRSATRAEAALALAELCGNAGGSSGKASGRQHYEDVVADAAVPRLVWMLEAKSAPERDAAARALAAVLAASSACRKAFRRDERGVVNAVQLLAGDGSGAQGGSVEERRFPVSVLLAVAPSRRCRKQMVAAGACGFLQALVAGEVDGAKRLAQCLGKGKMLGVFPRT